MASPIRSVARTNERTGLCLSHHAFAGLVALFLMLTACAGPGGADEAAPFVLTEDDYPLSCDPTGNSAAALACQLAYYTNRERQAHPEESDAAGPLDWSAELAGVAREYSRRMCDEGFFDHRDPQGLGIEARLLEAGINYIKAGENLARGNGMLPSKAMSLFMDEPSCRLNHRHNVLDNDFTHAGAGAVFCRDTTVYTQLFATFDAEALRDDANEYCPE